MTNYWKSNDEVILALYDYPAVAKFGYALDVLAEGGRYFEGPSGNKPDADWLWKFKSNIWPAVEKLCAHNNFELTEKQYG